MILLRLFMYLILVPSAVFHEYMHGWTAHMLGDDTAKRAGRLTMNPLKHIDLMGTIILPLALFIASSGGFLFAYAKPVPYNPYNLRNQKWGPVLVGLAGPLGNLLLAVLFGIVVRIANMMGEPSLFVLLGTMIVEINIVLAIFNLVPIPPLDGSKLLLALLPRQAHNIEIFLERWGLLIVFVFAITGFKYLFPIINYLTTLLTGW